MKKKTRDLLGMWAAIVAMIIGIIFMCLAIKFGFFN